MSGEWRIPPNVLVPDFARVARLHCFCAEARVACCCSAVQRPDRPWRPRRGGWPEWSLLVSALICTLSCTCICVSVCVHLYLIRVPGRACAGPNGHFGQRSGRLLYHTSSSSSVHLYLCTSVIHMPTRVLA